MILQSVQWSICIYTHWTNLPFVKETEIWTSYKGSEVGSVVGLYLNLTERVYKFVHLPWVQILLSICVAALFMVKWVPINGAAINLYLRIQPIAPPLWYHHFHAVFQKLAKLMVNFGKACCYIIVLGYSCWVYKNDAKLCFTSSINIGVNLNLAL